MSPWMLLLWVVAHFILEAGEKSVNSSTGKCLCTNISVHRCRLFFWQHQITKEVQIFVPVLLHCAARLITDSCTRWKNSGVLRINWHLPSTVCCSSVMSLTAITYIHHFKEGSINKYPTCLSHVILRVMQPVRLDLSFIPYICLQKYSNSDVN
jgi:hypothetical protein